jgi:heat shock protein HslJ
MKKTIKIILLIVVMIILVIIGLVKSDVLNEDLYGDAHIQQPDGSIVKLNDIRGPGLYNTTYGIENESVTLIEGVSEKEIVLGAASKIVTKYFGNEVRVDIDNDNQEDAIFLLTQETGGTGTFFYVVAALNTEEGWKGSNALFLGDRITPKNIELSTDPSHENVIIVNYLDRKFEESMSTEPSIKKTIWIKFDTQSMSFGEVEQNFEGEADPNMMTLDMKPWRWVKTSYNNDAMITPENPDDFTITFNDDRTFSATTDCNSMSGEYKLDNNQITFGENIAMTKMFCENSQEQKFISLLNEVQFFFFTSKGELVFNLKFDSGSAIFR